MSLRYLILLPILIPLAGGFIVWGIGRFSDTLGGAVTTLLSGATLFSVGWMYYLLNRGAEFSVKLNIGIPKLPLHLEADALGLFLSLITAFVWVLASLYAIEYIEERRTLFNVFLLFSLYGMLGINLTGNLFSLLLFFEFFSVASAVLVIHEGTREAVRAGFQYLFISIVGSVAIILAAAVIWIMAGSIDIVGTTGYGALKSGPLTTLLFWLLILGFAIKAGMFPVHIWLPEAHPIAPSPASALLSGVMIKAGAYGIIRVVYGIFGARLVSDQFMIKTLMVLAVVTMILGSILAITQTELKRLLAYSSVAQIGYVVLGVTLLNPNGLAGGVLHIFNHALMKGALFLAAGSIIHKTGLRRLEDLKGLGKAMPLTMTAFTMAALSMIGIPPFVGFFSKWLLGLGALDAGAAGLISPLAAYAIVGALILSGLLNIVYYGPIIMRGWFENPPGVLESAGHRGHAAPAHANDGGSEVSHGDAHHNPAHENHSNEESPRYVRNMEPSWIMTVPTLTLALATLVFGFDIKLPMRLVEGVVRMYLQ